MSTPPLPSNHADCPSASPAHTALLVATKEGGLFNRAGSNCGSPLLDALVETVAAEEVAIEEICDAVEANDTGAVVRLAKRLAGMRRPPVPMNTCA